MTGALGWQDAVVIAVVTLAGAWLVWHQLRRRRLPTPMCGDCPACATRTNAKPPVAAGGGGLISIAELTRRETAPASGTVRTINRTRGSAV